MSSPRQWVCNVCGYIHEGDEPPDVCPVCGAGADAFSPVESGPASAPDAAPDGESVSVVVVGASAAGLTAAEQARQFNARADITLLSAENRLPYYRLNLTRWLAREIDEDALTIHPASWYEEQRIDLRIETPAERIDTENKQVHAGGEVISYDKLVLAVGAQPFIPPIEGVDRKNVMTLRTLDDGRHLIAEAESGKRFVCIGGGILGLETAGGLAARGARITILERAEWLMNRQLEQSAGQRLADRLKERGMEVVTAANTASIDGDDKAERVVLEDGREMPADYVVITAGVRSRLDLAESTGLKTDRGLTVDSLLRTSNHDIYAAGDVSELDGELYGLWGPAVEQGRIAGRNAAGDKTTCGALSRETVVKVLGIDIHQL